MTKFIMKTVRTEGLFSKSGTVQAMNQKIDIARCKPLLGIMRKRKLLLERGEFHSFLWNSVTTQFSKFARIKIKAQPNILEYLQNDLLKMKLTSELENFFFSFSLF